MKEEEVGWAYSMNRSGGKCIQICDGTTWK